MPLSDWNNYYISLTGIPGSQEMYSVTIGGIYKDDSFLKRQKELQEEQQQQEQVY